ncbi:unnamed protein product [Linum tenue]|uniref:KIB1-4 beta-propeller domain-containing protein n=2 Tax=Linum tenue TaxID=586396 RepID=A0AAV0RNM7_9ROSI|nr:unnamed protein product [Linum tenue]
MADGLKNWSELGEDLLCRIGQCLRTLEDVIRSRAVCKPWRRALLPEQQRRFSPFTQWLMLPFCRSNNMNMEISIRSTISDSLAAAAVATPVTGCKGSENCRCFYNVALHQFHHIEFPQGLQGKRYRGSTMGWLCIVDKTPSISLLNPLTKTEIPLPPATSFPDVLAYRPEKARGEYLLRMADGSEESISKNFFLKKYLKRVVVSAEPTLQECIVMAIRWNTEDNRLAFCRPAEIEAGWKLVAHEEENGIPPDKIGFVDVVFWRDRFYALDWGGRILVCDFSANPHHPTLSFFLEFHSNRYGYSYADNQYLVVCPAAVTGDDDDQLVMVSRFTKWMDIDESDDDSNSDDDCEPSNTARTYWAEKFKVFKMKKDVVGWDEFNSIGEFALFLGFSSSATFVHTKAHPGVVPNSIYFTDDIIDSHRGRMHGGHDMGVYNLATQKVMPLYSTTTLHDNPVMISPLPLWFSPSIVTGS